MSELWILSSVLLILAWIFSRQPAEDGPPLFNDEGVLYYDPDKVLTPTTVHEVQMIVRDARKKGQMIRPLGSGHSWTTVGLSEDIYISLYKYRGLVKLDKLVKTASFKGGTRLWEINNILAKHDFCLSVLPSVSNQTIGGLVATGTHGSGVNFGNMVTYVTDIELVTGMGEVLRVSPESDPELFNAAAVSIGLLGIITEVTLSIEPIFNLHETCQSFTLTHCIENIQQIAASSEHVKVWAEVVSGSCAVFSANRTVAPADTVPVISQPMTDIRMYAYEILQWLLSLFPPATDVGFGALFATDVFPAYERTAISWEVFNIPHYVAKNHREAEVAVPLDKCGRAMEDLIEAKKRLNFYINHVVEIRFVKQDSFWMSNNYKMDACHITLMLYNPSDYYWKLYTEAVFNVTSSYGGRPHWGKSFNMSSSNIKQLYPKFGDFLDVRKKLDPDRVFVNDILSQTFGIDE